MRRLQIYLPEETYQELRSEAYTKNSSIAEIVRKRMFKENTRKKVVRKTAENPFGGLLKIAKSMEKRKWKNVPKDLSSRVDYYLYGEGSRT